MFAADLEKKRQEKRGGGGGRRERGAQQRKGRDEVEEMFGSVVEKAKKNDPETKVSYIG